MKVTRSAFLGAAFLFLAACDDSSPSDAGASGAGRTDTPDAVDLPPDLRADMEEFCEWWGELTCDLALENRPLRVDTEHCASTEARRCAEVFVPEIALGLVEGRLVYRPENRERVAADLRLQEGDREALPSWRSLFVGTVPNGDACGSHESYGFYANECSDGVCDSYACGTCRPFPGPGEACDWTENRCSPSAGCMDTGCEELPDEGQDCDPEGITCLPPFRCRSPVGGGTGVCGLRAELGEVCERTAECHVGACHDGECTLLAVDEPCEYASECETDLSCIGGVCVPRGTRSASSCRADRDCVEGEVCRQWDIGANCEPPGGAVGGGCGNRPGSPRCKFGLACLMMDTYSGTCDVPGEVGDACSAESCASGYCVGGTCQATPRPRCDPTP